MKFSVQVSLRCAKCGADRIQRESYVSECGGGKACEMLALGLDGHLEPILGHSIQCAET